MRFQHGEDFTGLHTLAQPPIAFEHATGLRREDADQAAGHIHFTAHHRDIAGLGGMRFLHRSIATGQQRRGHEHNPWLRTLHEDNLRPREEVSLMRPSSMRYKRSA